MGFSPSGHRVYDPGTPTEVMAWLAPATFGLFAAGAGTLCYVLVANLEPQPEYPALMTDLMRLLRAGIAICGLAIGGVFLYAAAGLYLG
ncbi:hypothetical protein [Natronorubrum tibetense]|nr:hypothetical protein [Natronorubrum tibetense]